MDLAVLALRCVIPTERAYMQRMCHLVAEFVHAPRHTRNKIYTSAKMAMNLSSLPFFENNANLGMIDSLSRIGLSAYILPSTFFSCCMSTHGAHGLPYTARYVQP